jgi:crotonobetainyl-CoA:carnitine CoA-transferase CaiB-like acyl-CoA transferase
MGPLEGIRVMEMADSSAGCVAGMLLSDYGATVIRVERPGDEAGRSAEGFVVWNRGKKSLRLNLETPQGRELFFRLLHGTDVFLETLMPGESERLGIDYNTVHPRFPRLVYCSLTGYDVHGPDKHRPGYDGLVQARAGLMTQQWSLEGDDEHRPGPKYMGFATPTYASAFFACLGLLTALYVRGTTGQGQYVNTSLYGGAQAMTRWGWAENPGPPPPPVRRLFGMWQCEDGEYLWTHTGSRGAFNRYMKILGLEEYSMSAPNPPPWSAALHQELRRQAREILKTKPRAEWIRLFDAADCPNHPVLHPGDDFDDEQVQVINMVVDVDDPELGTLREVGVPIKFAKTPGAVTTSAPLAGQHTSELLSELGISQEELASLHRDGVI